jgi:hypothetical protein
MKTTKKNISILFYTFSMVLCSAAAIILFFSFYYINRYDKSESDVDIFERGWNLSNAFLAMYCFSAAFLALSSFLFALNKNIIFMTFMITIINLILWFSFWNLHLLTFYVISSLLWINFVAGIITFILFWYTLFKGPINFGIKVEKKEKAIEKKEIDVKKIDKLKKLHDLYVSGAISQSEYENEKRRII